MNEFQEPVAGRVPAGSGPERRIVGLDGLRGVACLMVLASHFFGEVPHGIAGLRFGWIAVDIFFVLSGFLIGRLILQKQSSSNFFFVFYARRFARIIPAYVITVVVCAGLIARLPASWTDAAVRFPTWSYLTFLQGFHMLSTGSIGAHWLAPTWTLAVEEHFYLIAPAAIVFTPRRLLGPVLWGSIGFAVIFRAATLFGGASSMWALALLPGRADLLAVGILTAILVESSDIDWKRIEPVLPWTASVSLALAIGFKRFGVNAFETFNPIAIAFAMAGLILCIVRRLPMGRRFDSKALRFCGDNAYCIYLTHLPVLGLMHGLFLKSTPDVSTPTEWAVTIAALPVSLLIGWAMTKIIEEPLTRYGRHWKWAPPVAIDSSARPAPASPI